MNRDVLCRQLGYEFKRPELLQRALTHRSHSPENYERLEFLGDSVLGLAISDLLYARLGQLPEGDLSRVRPRRLGPHRSSDADIAVLRSRLVI